jgi:hypothetical protein
MLYCATSVSLKSPDTCGSGRLHELHFWRTEIFLRTGMA